MAVNQSQVDHIITAASEDDPEVKLQNLEREVDLIKTSIKRLLMDIRERMNELENPFALVAGGSGNAEGSAAATARIDEAKKSALEAREAALDARESTMEASKAKQEAESKKPEPAPARTDSRSRHPLFQFPMRTENFLMTRYSPHSNHKSACQPRIKITTSRCPVKN